YSPTPWSSVRHRWIGSQALSMSTWSGSSSSRSSQGWSSFMTAASPLRAALSSCSDSAGVTGNQSAHRLIRPSASAAERPSSHENVFPATPFSGRRLRDGHRHRVAHPLQAPHQLVLHPVLVRRTVVVRPFLLVGPAAAQQRVGHPQDPVTHRQARPLPPATALDPVKGRAQARVLGVRRRPRRPHQRLPQPAVPLARLAALPLTGALVV